jgi:DNA-binding NarL/FixJ family response regulator
VPGIDTVTPIADRDRLVEEIARTSAILAVIDLDPGGTGALDKVRELSAVAQRVSVVLLVDRVDGAFALAAMRSGVRGLVLKPDALRELAPVLRRVLAGERVIDPALEDASVTSLGRFARQAREGSRAEAMLSPREMQILLLMGDGLTMQQIARRLGISPRTVETHATNLYRKLDVRTRVQAVAKAATIGLIEMG